MRIRHVAVMILLVAAPLHAQRDTARTDRAIGNPDPRTGQTEKPPRRFGGASVRFMPKENGSIRRKSWQHRTICFVAPVFRAPKPQR